MPTAIVSVTAAHSVRLPGEALAFSLLLRNPTADDLTVPLSALRWWAGAKLTLTRPDGSRTEFVLGPEAQERDAHPLTIFEEAELEFPFTLDGVTDRVFEPGWYALDGTLPTGEGDWPIAGARWYVEPVLPIEACVATAVEGSVEDTLQYWKLIRGERRSALYGGMLGLNDISCAEAVHVSGSDWLADVGRRAHSLTAMERRGEPIPWSEAWIAWLEAKTLHAGVAFALFNTTSVELPGEPARIIPNLTPAGDGTADVWVLGSGEPCLWRVRLPRPEKIAPPANPPDDPDYFPDPRDLVRIAPPKVISLALPAVSCLAAVARWKDITAVALVTQLNGMVEVHYGVLKGEGLVWGSARIDEAEHVPGADPVIALDDRGVGRVGVLFRSSESLGVAALAFDSEAKPLWSSGIRRELTTGRAAVEHGAISLLLDIETTRWGCSWAVTAIGGAFLLSGGDGTSARIRPLGKPLERTTIAVWPGTIAAAYQTEQGDLRFASARDWRRD